MDQDVVCRRKENSNLIYTSQRSRAEALIVCACVYVCEERARAGSCASKAVDVSGWFFFLHRDSSDLPAYADIWNACIV